MQENFLLKLGRKSLVIMLLTHSIVQNLNPKTPGPGTYDLIPEISPSGNYFLSKFRSPKAPQFNPPHSKRFQDIG